MPKYGICNLQTLLLEYQAYPRSKKISTLFNDWENIAFGEESEKSEALANKFGLLQIRLGGLGGSQPQEKSEMFRLIYAWKQYFQQLN